MSCIIPELESKIARALTGRLDKSGINTVVGSKDWILAASTLLNIYRVH